MVSVKNPVKQVPHCHNRSYGCKLHRYLFKRFEMFMHYTNNQFTECGIWIDTRLCIIIRQCHVEIWVKLLWCSTVCISTWFFIHTQFSKDNTWMWHAVSSIELSVDKFSFQTLDSCIFSSFVYKLTLNSLNPISNFPL